MKLILRSTYETHSNSKMSTDTAMNNTLPCNILNKDECEASIERLCQIIRYPTVSSLAAETGEYRRCATWIKEQLHDMNIFHEVFFLKESPDDSPVVVAIWKGYDESLPIILLNSHYDVVPADDSNWTVPPFGAVRRHGNIYGRGTQDMKCVCVQYIDAIRKIHTDDPNWKPIRNIILTFVPDEEVGGAGMAAFLESSLYKQLPGIALALDEGLASETDEYCVFYGERLPWWVSVTASGPTGHGSRFIDNTAVEQIVALANKALEFREGQRQLLGLTHERNCSHAVAAGKKKTLGDVTSLNITTLEAGVRVGTTYAYNCVPPMARCSMDIRISPNTPPSQIRDMLDQWCLECSYQTSSKVHSDTNGVKWSFIGDRNDHNEHAVTSVDPNVNPWYRVFADTIEHCARTKVEPQIFPAATDSRFLRLLGIRALGFSPLRNTIIKLHEDDEYIPESVFVEGIGVYFYLIKALGSFVEGSMS